MTILGVDLGTTNSLAVVYKEGNPVLIPNAYGEYVTQVLSVSWMVRLLLGNWLRKDSLRIQSVVHLCLSEIWAQMLLIH